MRTDAGGGSKDALRGALPPDGGGAADTVVGACAGLIAVGAPASTAAVESIWTALGEGTNHPLSRLLLQLVVIVIAARVLGAVARRMHQPAVIGEIAAGILLGPSLLGAQLPQVSAFLFPDESLPALKLLSQIGIVLFMFVVGLELDLHHVRQHASAVVAIGLLSVAIPFVMGMALGGFVVDGYRPPAVDRTVFALFLGVAMSVTALPVLARILEERGLASGALGQTALAATAIADVLAWSLLAGVVALARARGVGSPALLAALVGLFVLLMFAVARPMLRWFTAARAHGTDGTTLTALLLFTFVSAWCTEALGLHALFGAFLAGVIMPRADSLRTALRSRLEPFCVLFLLPLFFAFTGLRTEVGLVSDLHAVGITALIVLVATAGKVGGTFLVARQVGMDSVDAFRIGALMNTRGLMELVLLHLGYELGVLSPAIFVMLVLMTLVTTFMTAPLLAWADHWPRKGRPA